MEEDIRLELFTVAEVRDWLEHNRSVRGLSEQLISKTRAWAIVNSPYAKDDIHILSAIFVNDEVAAFTAVFPEKMARPDRFVYWDTTLYVAPKYEGRGYAAIVIGAICEEYGDDYFDHAAADASVANFEFLGLPVYRVPQYIFRPKHFQIDTIKGKLAYCLSAIKSIGRKRYMKKIWSSISSNKYRLNYVDFVDEETYSFIAAHSEGDIWLRTREFFNWILQYGFNRETPLQHRITKNCEFSSDCRVYGKYAVQIWDDNQFCGFYILVRNADCLTVKYLYTDVNKKEDVFSSIAEHIVNLGVSEFVTYDKSLGDYIKERHLFPSFTIYMTSFTTPQGFEFDQNKGLQAGDGDMFS